MNRYGKRCVLYPRVSTEMQVDGYSLEGQKNMLTRFADREEMIVVDTYEDAGKSGKSIEGRPAFQKMLRDIEDGLDIDYILVYKLSRFGRNAADILNSLELVQSYGVNLICIEEGIDSSQTSGKLLISVLSAVAEIERENIIEQTMNGRREKARQGGWNGGFAPYGYTLEDNKLMIEETEAVAIRKIFELYTSSEIGLGGIANQLNLQGIRKIPRQNGTLEDWTGHFIKLILDNPVYCGKIAYGRRTKEKVKGTKNDYQMKRNDDYILTEGQHKGIVSEEVWEKAHAKRLRTGVKQPSKIGRDRVHLLSGLLKCPVCGSPMYTNKHAWTNKDGTYKEIYYYVCSRNRMVRGKHCEYKAMLKKTDIEPMVIEAIREIVRNEEYAQAIKKRIGVQIDTKAVDKELEGYQAKLKEVDLNKTRLEREIDSLPADAKYRERKLHDMTLRLDSLYDVIVELEEKIEDARLRRDAIKQQAITLENIYKIMVNFDCVYNIINDEEKRNVVTALIKEIEIYRNDESEYPLKRIGLNFPVFKDGGEVTELLWDKGNTVDEDWLRASDIVEDVRRVSEPYKLANRRFHPKDTHVNVCGRAVGEGTFTVIAGPCSVESREQLVSIAEDVKRSGATCLRGGAFKPRTSPYSFQGLENEGLKLLLEAKKETGLPIVTEIMSETQIDDFADVDVIQVGARNMQNFRLLKALGQTNKPILLKRGLSATIEEWLMSAEYVLAGGNPNVILCERGIRTFEKMIRNNLDISAVPLIKQKSHLPVIIDPSHAAGIAWMVQPLARTAIAAGADGLMIEVHNNPKAALCDGAQSLDPSQFDALMTDVKRRVAFEEKTLL